MPKAFGDGCRGPFDSAMPPLCEGMAPLRITGFWNETGCACAQPVGISAGPPPTAGVRGLVSYRLFVGAEEVVHGFCAGVAGVVEAAEAQTAFDGLEQREVGVVLRAGFVVRAVVGIDDRNHLVDIRSQAVVVFVPG